MLDLILRPGDIFFTHGDTIVSKLIRFFEISYKNCRTSVNHTGIVVKSGTPLSAEIVEALFTSVQQQTIMNAYKSTNTRMTIFRPLNLSDHQLNTIAIMAKTYVGKRYGYGILAAALLDYLLFDAFLFRRMISGNRHPICNWIITSVYSKVGIDFNCDPRKANPDLLLDYCVKRTDVFECIHGLEHISHFIG